MTEEWRNPPASAEELRAANEGWEPMPDYTGWRADPTRTFWVGIAIGACAPLLVGLIALVFLLVWQ